MRWTPDGRYVVAQGDHWLRLWHLASAARGLSFANELQPSGGVRGTGIERLALAGSLLCLTLRFTSATAVNAVQTPSARTKLAQWADRWPTLQRGQG